MSWFKNALLGIGLLLSLRVSAGPIGNLVAFGDSYTDSGNTASVPGTSVRPVPFNGAPPSYYAGGRFTDGLTWIEDLAAHFGWAAEPALRGGANYAFGGAQTGPLADPPGSAFPPGLANPAYPPSLLDQGHRFLDQVNGRAPADSLYAIFGGINDLYSDALPAAAAGRDPSPTLTNTANNIAELVRTLAAAGATDIFVMNMFDLGLTPQIRFIGNPANAATARSVTEAFNSTLDAVLDDLADTLPINLIRFDFFRFFDSVAANPGAFGFAETALPCARTSSVCSDPDSFVFWDGLHPTAAFHRVLAQAAISAVPQPSAPVLLIIGIYSLVCGRWWKRS